MLYRSLDDGATFAPVAGAPPVLALAARAGTVYAATDTTLVPFAEATSTDEGATWTPGMAFADVAAIAPCVKAVCQNDCAARAAQQQWPATMCVAAAPAPTRPTRHRRAVDRRGHGRPAAWTPRARIDAGDVPRPHTPIRVQLRGGARRSAAALAAPLLAGWPLWRRRRRR